MHLSCLLCTVQPREGSVMIWGCFIKPDLGSATLGGQKQWGQVTRSGSNVKECSREHEASFLHMGVSYHQNKMLMQLCLEIINVMTLRTCMKIWNINVVQKMIECLPPHFIINIKCPIFSLTIFFLNWRMFPSVSVAAAHAHLKKKCVSFAQWWNITEKKSLTLRFVANMTHSVVDFFYLFI